MRNTFTLLLVISMGIARAQNVSYTGQVDAGVLIGQPSQFSFSGQVFNGLKIEKWRLQGGMTVAADLYELMTLMPVTATVKYLPAVKGSVETVASLSAGYGLDWLYKSKNGNNYSGGLTVHPTIGIRLKSKTTSQVNFSAGFKHQRASSTFVSYDGLGRRMSSITDNYKFNRLTISAGMSF